MAEEGETNSLSKTDWIAFSFLTAIGPARLSRLFHYLTSLNEAQGLFKDTDHTVLTRQDINYDLLRSLKWPEATAIQAMEYLTHHKLSEEQQKKLDQTLEWLEMSNHHLILRSDSAYPTLLKEISTAPALLYLEGHLLSLAQDKIGIVGARKCSAYGRQITHEIATQLSVNGVCVVSGGALGIDTAAHRASLNAQATPTGVIMGTGLLHCYPKQNASLFKQVVEQQGFLLSEYPLTTEPRPHLFPPRNRIISGLSHGVLVTEASIKSGSLISANYALQQNREVFAVPARLSDKQSSGCLQLLRQGAVLVRSADDIINECPSLQSLYVSKANSETTVKDKSSKLPTAPKSPVCTQTTSSTGKVLMDLLIESTDGLDFDSLIRASDLDAPQLMQALMELELTGCVVNFGGLYRLSQD
ncbi:DNA-processing protein DprA [Marinomonas dokdonensis]|uniref:DNA-processing protein DprA n=1 Tax=Marinomonas dokdonensis TaxID=328224 RepID=UPI0040554C09